jgi:hypothetical protein
MLKLTLSQRMPNEVAGGLMPNADTKTWQVYDSEELSSLKDGDILFIDECFNGVLKSTLDSFLNILEDRVLPSGKPLADICILAASNPQGLIHITPQIKERFIRYDLSFNAQEFQDYLKSNWGVPFKISETFCHFILKEKFEDNNWNYVTPRSVEKALIQIANNLLSPLEDILMPSLLIEIECPLDLTDLSIKKGENIKFINLLKYMHGTN